MDFNEERAAKYLANGVPAYDVADWLQLVSKGKPSSFAIARSLRDPEKVQAFIAEYLALQKAPGYVPPVKEPIQTRTDLPVLYTRDEQYAAKLRAGGRVVEILAPYVPPAPKKTPGYWESVFAPLGTNALPGPSRRSNDDEECSMYEADRFTDGHDPSGS